MVRAAVSVATRPGKKVDKISFALLYNYNTVYGLDYLTYLEPDENEVPKTQHR